MSSKLPALKQVVVICYCKNIGPDDAITHAAASSFRAVQISEKLREKHGCPEFTPKLRANVFGLNAMKPYHISADEIKQHMAQDRIAKDRIAYREAPNPHFRTQGSKTRREFLNLLGVEQRAAGVIPKHPRRRESQ